MNKNLIVVLVAAIVVAAAGAGAYVLLKNNGDKNNYSLIDSTDNIKAGLTIEKSEKTGDDVYWDKVYVKSVKDGMAEAVYYTGYRFVNEMFDDYLPNGSEVEFDYTSDVKPAGITVEKSDNKYTINGKTTVGGEEITFNSLVIDYDGTKVTSVSGKISWKYNDSVRNYSLTTKDGKIIGDYDYQYSLSVSVSDIVADFLYDFDEDYYAGSEMTSEKGKYRGSDVTIYTLNGKDAFGSTYENFKIYVYGGYEIHSAGTYDGDPYEYTVSVYMA